MDKERTRNIAKSLGVSQAEFLAVDDYEYRVREADILEEIQKRLGFPVFVKPVNLGSSVGVTMAKDTPSLKESIRYAFEFDHRIILEEGLKVRELETALLGNSDNIRISEVGEVVVHSEFYSYNAKYHDPDAYSLTIPADIPDNVKELVKTTAIKMYRALNCEGYARADLFYIEEDDRICFNEINTIPGCTPISMFPRLWNHAGVNGNELVNAIIDCGFLRHERQLRLNYKYNTSDIAAS